MGCPIKIAIVGAGYVSNLRHIPALRATRRCDIIGIIDTCIDNAAATAKRFAVRNVTTDMNVPWLNDADAVCIGTPPDSHYELMKHFLEHGKHVICEKPFTLESNDAAKLVTLADEQNLTLSVVHNFQYANSAQKLAKLIELGALGALKSLTVFQLSSPKRRLPQWAESLPLGLFFDEAPHLFYLLRRFGGPVTVQSATTVPSTRNLNTPSSVSGQLQAGELPATLYINFEAPVSEWHFMAIGERGVAVMDIFRDVLVTIPNDGAHKSIDGLMTSGHAFFTHFHGVLRSGLNMLRRRLLYGNVHVFNRFLDCVESGKRPLGIDAEDGHQVVAALHEFIRVSGRQPS